MNTIHKESTQITHHEISLSDNEIVFILHNWKLIIEHKKLGKILTY